MLKSSVEEVRMLSRCIHLLLSVWIPEPLVGELRREFDLGRIRWGNRHLPWRRRRYYRFGGMKNLKVHLGSFDLPLPGWVNVDCSPSYQLDLLGDIRDPLPFGTGNAELILMEHVLEHFRPYTEAADLLRECRRILAPGGCLFLSVPDGEKAAKAYVSNDPWLTSYINSDPSRVDMIEKKAALDTPMEALNEIARQSGDHRFMYDFETLALQLRKAGFQDIRRSSYAVGFPSRLKVGKPDREEESLCVEAFA